MPDHLTVTPDAVTLDPQLLAGRASLDVLLNGHRVWSVDLVSTPPPPDGRLPWPTALLPHLDGTATVIVQDSVSGATLASTEVRLGSSAAPIAVVDSNGRHLAVNKWGRLGKSFEGSEPALRATVLNRLDELVQFCQERDLRPFVVGGTLLGAVREGAILGHDDDADLAYLSRHTHPSDLALENFEIERALVARGIEVIRHSTAHLQLTFRRPDGHVDAYVDLFTAFFRADGTINQPFHVRGPMATESMLPFSTVTLEGRSYPAPAVPEDWLVLNYDENWRTPLPGYVLRTPQATRRRFLTWFGRYNFQRDFWEERYEQGPTPSLEVDLRGADALHAAIPPGSRVLDLGCGSGEAAVQLARAGHRVLAVDYSPEAIARTRAAAAEAGVEIETRVRNVIAIRQTAELLEDLRRAGEPIHVLVSHLVERQGHRGRQNTWRVLRQFVRRGGRVMVLIDTQLGPDFARERPSTWHLPPDTVKTELSDVGLALVHPRALTDTDRDEQRRPLLFELALLPGPVVTTEKGSAS